MRILIAGGAGYVGSHVVRECRRVGHEVVVFDNYSTGHADAIDGVEQVSGDVRDYRVIRSLLENYRFDAAVHLAASFTAASAAAMPARALQTVVGGSLQLIDGLIGAGVERLVVGTGLDAHRSDSLLAGAQRALESHLATITSRESLVGISLRIGNVAGADLGADLGEHHREEQHVIPSIFRSVLGLQGPFEIRGTELDTPDGTPARDFVHVTDVARAFVSAMEISSEVAAEDRAFDIATGRVTTVRQLVDAVRSLIPDLEWSAVEVAPRPGSPASVVGDPTVASRVLGWTPQFSDLTSILRTAWAWHSRFPSGYEAGRVDPATPSPDRASGEKFGAVAVRLGFASEDDIRRALDRQEHEASQGGEHKLIGLHMLELGILSTSQLIDILRSYEER